jgi:uncharacterized pyridoxamine 5'-phosphate oxidase family protein
MFQQVLEFLQTNSTFYIATVDGNFPRVRPFGAIIEHDGKLYFTTGHSKKVYQQMQTNPYVEISTTSASGAEWIRLRGKAVYENNLDVKKKAFDKYPFFNDLYQTPDNPTFEVFYLADAEGEFWSMTAPPKPFQL